MATINTICHAIKIIIRLTETLCTSLLTLPKYIYINPNKPVCTPKFINFTTITLPTFDKFDDNTFVVKVGVMTLFSHCKFQDPGHNT